MCILSLELRVARTLAMYTGLNLLAGSILVRPLVKSALGVIYSSIASHLSLSLYACLGAVADLSVRSCSTCLPRCLANSTPSPLHSRNVSPFNFSAYTTLTPRCLVNNDVEPDTEYGLLGFAIDWVEGLRTSLGREMENELFDDLLHDAGLIGDDPLAPIPGWSLMLSPIPSLCLHQCVCHSEVNTVTILKEASSRLQAVVDQEIWSPAMFPSSTFDFTFQPGLPTLSTSYSERHICTDEPKLSHKEKSKIARKDRKQKKRLRERIERQVSREASELKFTPAALYKVQPSLSKKFLSLCSLLSVTLT